jgi:hypothetical protein
MLKKFSRKMKAIGATLSGLSIMLGWFGLKPPPPTKQEVSTQLEKLLGKPPQQNGTLNKFLVRNPDSDRDRDRNNSRRCQQLEFNSAIRFKSLPNRDCPAGKPKPKTKPKKRKV